MLDSHSLRWCWAGVALFLVAMVAIGFAGRARVRSREDYALAGRRFGFAVSTLALLASWFGVGSCLGIAGAVCIGGLADVAADPFASAASLVLSGLFLAGALRKAGGMTVTDCIASRFGRWAGVYAAAWMVPVYAGWLGSLVIGLGTIVNLLTGADPVAAQWIGAGVILLYTVAGGMWAVSVTDIVQMLLVLLGLAVVLPGSVSQAGGLAEILSRNAQCLSLAPGPPPEGATAASHFAYVAGTWMIMGLGCMVGQDLMQRVFACRTPRIAARSTVATGFLYLAVAAAPVLIGLAAKTVLPANGVTPESVGPEFGNQVFARMAIIATEGLPPFAVSLVFCAIVSAIMSSADSALLAASSLVVNGIAAQVRPGIARRRPLALARAATVAVLVAAVLLAMRSGSVYRLMVNSWAAQLVVVFIPVVAAVHLPKAPRAAAWAAMTVAPAVWAACVARAVAACVSGGASLADSLVAPEVDYAFTAGAAHGFFAGLASFALGCVPWKRLARQCLRLGRKPASPATVQSAAAQSAGMPQDQSPKRV